MLDLKSNQIDMINEQHEAKLTELVKLMVQREANDDALFAQVADVMLEADNAVHSLVEVRALHREIKDALGKLKDTSQFENLFLSMQNVSLRSFLLMWQ